MSTLLISMQHKQRYGRDIARKRHIELGQTISENVKFKPKFRVAKETSSGVQR